MFHWSDQHQQQARGTLQEEFSGSEDHIVFHPREIEEYATFTSREDRKKQRNDGVKTDAKSTEQVSHTKNDFLSSKLQSSYSFHTDGLSASRYEMDVTLDLPNFCLTLDDCYIDENYRNSTAAGLNDLTDVSDLDSVAGDPMQLDGGPDKSDHEDKGSYSFPDYDWDRFVDPDDLHKIIGSNDSMFGRGMINDAGGFLSPSKDVINSTAQSIPMPDIPLVKEETSDEDYYFQLDEHSSSRRNPRQTFKVADFTGGAWSQHDSNLFEPYGLRFWVNEQRERARSEWNENKISMDSEDAQSHSVNKHQQNSDPKLHNYVAASSQSLLHKLIGYQTQATVEHLGSLDQITLGEHEYSTNPLSSISVTPDVHAGRSQNEPIPACHMLHTNYSNCLNFPSKPPDTIPVIMTPQEKIGKLRRQQQVQTTRAIQQQHQKYGNQVSGTDSPVSQAHSQMNQSKDAGTSTVKIEECANHLLSPEVNMIAEQDEAQKFSSSIDVPSIEIRFSQLQDDMKKLDTKVRLCIRDSLIRLAKSAMERQSATDESGSNKRTKYEVEVSAEEETKYHDRSTTLPDSKEHTNSIDRNVVCLLFQMPTTMPKMPT